MHQTEEWHSMHACALYAIFCLVHGPPAYCRMSAHYDRANVKSDFKKFAQPNSSGFILLFDAWAWYTLFEVKEGSSLGYGRPFKFSC